MFSILNGQQKYLSTGKFGYFSSLLNSIILSGPLCAREVYVSAHAAHAGWLGESAWGTLCSEDIIKGSACSQEKSLESCTASKARWQAEFPQEDSVLHSVHRKILQSKEHQETGRRLPTADWVWQSCHGLGNTGTIEFTVLSLLIPTRFCSWSL